LGIKKEKEKARKKLNGWGDERKGLLVDRLLGGELKRAWKRRELPWST